MAKIAKRSSRKLEIADPAPDREPRKANVYQFILNSNAALAPLFPYADEGSIVPCVSGFRGGPGKSFGRFQHFNTVDEVVLVLGASGSQNRAGTVFVGPKLHMVQDPFVSDEERANPDAVRLAVITQRQSSGRKQQEEVRFVCAKCERRLFVVTLDATPPRRGEAQTEDGATPFVTIVETYEAARSFNDNPDNLVCKHCGHVNDPFPIDSWGWGDYVENSAVSRFARRSLKATGL